MFIHVHRRLTWTATAAEMDQSQLAACADIDLRVCGSQGCSSCSERPAPAVLWLHDMLGESSPLPLPLLAEIELYDSVRG